MSVFTAFLHMFVVLIQTQVTLAVFIGTPPPVGYGLGPFAVAGSYG